MAEEVLIETLEGNIPLADVLTWISHENVDSFNEKFTCSRGDFVLCILNFLRQSTARAWPQSATSQSPMKSVSKSFQLSKRRSSPHRTVDKNNHRRVELFPVSGSPHARKTSDQEKTFHRSPVFPQRDSEVFETLRVSGNQSPNTQSPTFLREVGEKSILKSKLRDEEKKVATPEMNSLATSSPLSSSIISDGSPQLTPINKRVSGSKSNERRSPAVTHNSPDYHFKTPSRGNGMCLGDFIAKGAKGPKGQQATKRFSLSSFNNPVVAQDNSFDDQQNTNSNKKKHRRRINPTKVTLENNPSSPQCSFQDSRPFGSASYSIPATSPFQALVNVEPLGASQSFSEERNLLKQERLKLRNQGEHMIPQSPTMNSSLSAKAVPPKILVVPDPEKVSYKDQLLKFCDMYCCILNANLVPNLMTELYFIVSLLVIRCDFNVHDDVNVVSSFQDSVQNVALKYTDTLKYTEKHDISMQSSEGFLTPAESKKNPLDEMSNSCYFSTVHNCVFFATNVLCKLTDVLGNMDRITLKLLLESERIASFAPALRERLLSVYTSASSKTRMPQGSGSASFKAVLNGNVSFQSETDNSSNFPSAQCFSNFRKQRDGFYELLRIWEANHLKQGWCFATTLGNRVRSLLQLCCDPTNLMHFARLFRLQLVSTVSGQSCSDEGPEDLQFLEGLRGVDPNKLNRLRDRLVTPYKAGGPRPQPSFPGSQEFYHDFIVSSFHASFLQHLQDSLIAQLLELDQTLFLASDTEDSDFTVDMNTRQSYLSCVSTMRLLAKFLGLIVFLPYNRPETALPQNIFETEVSLRSKVMPSLDVLKCVVQAYKTHRLVMTVPWVVKFLGMMDRVSCALPIYQTVLRLLLRLYLDLRHGHYDNFNGKSLVLPPQTVLLLRLSLGWLFEAPFIQESLFYSWCFNQDDISMLTLDVTSISITDHSLPTLDSSDIASVSSSTVPPVDALNLIDCEVLYSLCPFLLELRALLASTPTSECTPSASVRHITPVSAGSSLSPSASSGKQLELRLEESFFHGLPASVHRTVEFVVERVTSSCVKHICNVWLPGLKRKGVLALQQKIKTHLDNADVDSEIGSSTIQGELKKEIGSIVDQVAKDLKAKCRSGVTELCSTKCKGALMSLLPEESLSLPVCEMCISIASRMSEERVISWMQSHATLSLYSKDLLSEAEKALKNRDRGELTSTAKTSHIAPGASASWSHEDSAPSPFAILQTLKLLVSDILNGQTTTKDYVIEVLNKMEECVSKRQDVVPAAERILALLSVDLVISLVCHDPGLVDSTLISRLISLWKSDALRPVEDGLARLVCPRNMLLLAQSNHPTRLVWEKLAEVVAAVLKANLVTPDLVENQCLAIMQQEWPQNILRCFSMCMNEVVRQYQKQRDVDYKFILLLEWLAETMAQMDHFPQL